jgi:hypothetical protein
VSSQIVRHSPQITRGTRVTFIVGQGRNGRMAGAAFTALRQLRQALEAELALH